MKRISIIISFLLLIGVLAACGNNDEENLNEELPTLDVGFDVPETIDLGETINLEAHVTYDDEPEEEAEVVFEIWKLGHEDDSEMLDGKNEGGGDYTLDYTFEDEAVYEMYAHTDAQGLHTMPKKQIVIGDAEVPEEEDENNEADFHTEGFDMDFDNPEDVNKNEEITLETNVILDEEALEDLDVRYEIVLENDKDNTEWINAEEDPAGEYSAIYTFPEEGIYNVTIHVEDDDELHEHNEYELTVD